MSEGRERESESESAFEVSETVRSVPPSGIRRFFELAEEADDVISLGVGEPDFTVPWRARQAAITSLERGKTSYTANRGMRELRERIADHVPKWGLEYDPDEEILVTSGASEAVDLTFRALIDPGDVVAVATPTYVSYAPGVRFAGGEPLPVPTRAEDEFALTREALEAAGAGRADALVYCFPNNPTGATMSRDQLGEVAAFAREHDLVVLSDEIYADLTYGGEHASIATLPGMRERTVVYNGFSKAYAMTGLRLGYALGPPDVIGAMNRVHQYTMLSAPTTAQYAAVEALESCDDAVAEMREQYDRRRKFVLSRFEDVGVDCFEARGAFYLFPECPWDDSEAFAEALLQEEGVAMVPGTAFGAGGEGHLRASYATGLNDLREAMDRLERFLS
jgi:aminotransferase